MRILKDLDYWAYQIQERDVFAYLGNRLGGILLCLTDLDYIGLCSPLHISLLTMHLILIICMSNYA